MNNQGVRSNTLDIAKGVTIILMVIGHCYSSNNCILTLIYGFHMPAFFMISGMIFGMKLMEPAAEHIRLLEEGDLLYRILESEIRNTRTPLPILFGELSDRTNTRWHNFFLSFLSH